MDQKETIDSTSPSDKLKEIISHPVTDLFDWMTELHRSLSSFVESTFSPLNDDNWGHLQFLKQGTIVAELKLAFPKAGGFVLRRSWNENDYTIISYDEFDQLGMYIKNSADFNQELYSFETQLFEPQSGLINCLYQFLQTQYLKASEGKIETRQIHLIEEVLQAWDQMPSFELSIKKRADDASLLDIFDKLTFLEANPVLKWTERQVVIAQWYERLNQRILVKSRAHKLSLWSLKTSLYQKKIAHFFKRIKMRPKNNILGLINQYTIGKIIWFFSTVKNNLGYSVALAVYGPFTYYFITMPMNPHAMSAVGKVRNAYLELKQTLTSEITELTESKVKSVVSVQKDAVTLSQATHQQPNPRQAVPSFNQIIGLSDVTLTSPGSLMVLTDDGVKKPYQSSFLNMILSTDVSMVDQQSWNERMGRFKNMQISLEENLEYAPRMGRLEQLETQYNFPMMVETTWEELDRYLQLIYKIRTQYSQISPKFKQYLVNEVNRTQQLQLYLWDRMSRFILDQPYVMLDQDKEQKRNDYYIGRSFIFMEEMTQVLSWRYNNFKKPVGFEKIESLAKFYKEQRKESGNILTNLKNNSDLFKQKELLSTAEFRSYMKRQWEILFLQNAKAEEASNNGLNMYIWSVRNTVWVLQSLYSSRREDLELLLAKDQKGLLTNEEIWRHNKIELLYETLIHNLTLEYVGIRKEISENLGKDLESIQREIILSNLKEFVIDRNKLLNKHQDDVLFLGSKNEK
jgi:hypothetical protein